MITQALVEGTDMNKFRTIYIIATEPGYPVYLKCGFELEAEYADFDILPGKFTSEISPHIIPFDEKYKNQILELDKITTGESRSERLKEHLHVSSVFLSGNKISGAFFPDLGEGLIIADEPSAGIELMKFRIQTGTYSIFPLENRTALEFYRLRVSKKIKK
ncbi:MAG TPA: hypothetical protein PKA90_13650 [Ignavibacteria bacterium]|nr:hypothetical protein [Ignavibacteria bacterium]